MTKFLANIILLNLMLSAFGCQHHTDIDVYLNEQFQKGKLNGNVLVIKDGKTLYEKSFGYADGSKNILLNKDFRFNIGSVYKEFPAVAIMQLQEKKLLDINDKISAYIPDLPLWSEKVSLKHLLQYSSGLPTIGWGAYFSKGLSVTGEDIFNEVKDIKTLAFDPGSDYIYTNHSPMLLMRIVENITKLSFSDYVKEHIFAPLK